MRFAQSLNGPRLKVISYLLYGGYYFRLTLGAGIAHIFVLLANCYHQKMMAGKFHEKLTHVTVGNCATIFNE